MVALVYLYLVAAVLVAIMGKIRGRRAWRWFLIALAITPLAAGILVVVLPPLPPPPLPPSEDDEEPPIEATLRVIRRSSALDALRPYLIYVNGAELGSVAQDSVVDFQVPSGPLLIEAYCDWAGSPPLTVEVAPNDRIDIEVANAWRPMRALWTFAFRPNSYLTLRQLPTTEAAQAAA